MWKSLWRAALFTHHVPAGNASSCRSSWPILVDRVTQPRLATFYRVILLIPAVIPSTLVFVLWKWMYNYQVGPINHFLVDILGLFTVYRCAAMARRHAADACRRSPSWKWWWGLGYHTIFFLAGLAAIPRDLPEAARIDGANEWQIFWHITLPRPGADHDDPGRAALRHAPWR